MKNYYDDGNYIIPFDKVDFIQRTTLCGDAGIRITINSSSTIELFRSSDQFKDAYKLWLDSK